MKDSLSEKVYAFTAKNALLSAPCHILLGLSGGADSMALLHILTHWPDAGLKVSAVHIHHGLRGHAADRDAEFVRQYCEKQGVSLVTIREDVAAVAQRENCSLEEAGRRVRYQRFEELRRQLGADCVVTAHTASDQAETILMRVMRGSGVDGLQGISVARGHIRRPLLCAYRDEIEAYCADHDVPYVLDETNADTRFTRNFVRHNVLPMLREMNPSVDEALNRLAKHAAADALYLASVADEALKAARCTYGYEASGFIAQPSVIRRRMIKALLQPVPTVEESHLVAAELAVLSSGRVSLPDGWVFAVEQDVVSVYQVKSAPALYEIPSVPFELDFGCFHVMIERMTASSKKYKKVHSLLLQSAIDYDKISGKLYLRCRREGDYMHPSGRGVGKSIKKLMNEWRIPAHLRDMYPLLCDDAGAVLVPGYGCDDRVKSDDHTKHYLVCQLSKV